jgi:hypothetical protein
LLLGLTSLQASAQPAYDSKTPGAKGTEQAIERATEQSNESAEKAKEKEEDKSGQKQNYKGTLVSITASSVSIKLDDGTPLTFAINANTRVKIPGAGNGNGNGNGKGLGNGNSKKAPVPTDIQPGAKVMVQAVAGQNGAQPTARHIMLIPGKPETTHHVGTVSEYTPGKSLSIVSQDGQTSTFALTGPIKILPEERAGELKVGSRVTVIYGRNPSGAAPDVRGIVVHPAGSGPKATATPKP